MQYYEDVDNLIIEYYDCPNDKWISLYAENIIYVKYNKEAELVIHQVFEEKIYEYILPYGRILEQILTMQYCVIENYKAKIFPYNKKVYITTAIKNNSVIKNEPFSEERRSLKSPYQLIQIEQLAQKKIVKLTQ